jgi:hypothetical protein
MTRSISKRQFTRDALRYTFEVFQRHETTLITDHGKPFAAIHPVETHFPVTITQEQLVRLQALYGQALSPPDLVERAVATLMEQTQQSERQDLTDYIQGMTALGSFRKSGETAIEIADVDWPE